MLPCVASFAFLTDDKPPVLAEQANIQGRIWIEDLASIILYDYAQFLLGELRYTKGTEVKGRISRELDILKRNQDVRVEQ